MPVACLLGKTVPVKQWKVVVAKLGAAQTLHESDVAAPNWLGALRSTLTALSEPPVMPQGASCTIDANGVATVFDPATRRKFVLTPMAAPLIAPLQAPVVNRPITTETPTTPKSASKPRLETLDYAEAIARRTRAGGAEPVPVIVGGAPAVPKLPPSDSEPILLELLLERNEEPSPENPLCYRERAFLMPEAATALQAEAALRVQLSELQRLLEGRTHRFVILAAFDHRWQKTPERPPTVVLQWRDWRDEVKVEYPAAVHFSAAPPAGEVTDQRLADAFAAAEELSQLSNPVLGLEFVLGLLEQTVPAEATSVCLYDPHSDELRFAAVAGPFAASMEGYGVPRTGGLFAQAVRAAHQASVFSDVLVEPAFNPLIDSRPGLSPRNMLLRPVLHELRLLGMLQFINRRGEPTFTTQDIHVANYVAERLADFLVKHEGR
jgi:hypothetical protein